MPGHLWVLGDSWTDPRMYPWAASSGWPTLLADRLGMGLVTSGRSGAGYVHRGDGLISLPVQALRGRGAGAGLVLVWGSLNDPQQGWPAADVRAAATLTYGLLRRLCPDAPLIVAGPQWGADPPTAALLAARDSVRDAAADAGADFIDPSGWFRGRPDLMLDPYHPNPAGHALIADRLEHDVALTLLARPTLRS